MSPGVTICAHWGPTPDDEDDEYETLYSGNKVLAWFLFTHGLLHQLCQLKSLEMFWLSNTSKYTLM